MTRDEVLAMAEQAGAELYGTAPYQSILVNDMQADDFVNKFYALAFEAGRKAAEQDRVDAARYRWLCEHANLSLGGVRGNCIIELDRYALMKTKSVELDEAIDRARSAK